MYYSEIAGLSVLFIIIWAVAGFGIAITTDMFSPRMYLDDYFPSFIVLGPLSVLLPFYVSKKTRKKEYDDKLKETRDEMYSLRGRMEKIDQTLKGYSMLSASSCHRYYFPGLIKKVEELEKENKKLKAIVAEAVDYIYKK